MALVPCQWKAGPGLSCTDTLILCNRDRSTALGGAERARTLLEMGNLHSGAWLVLQSGQDDQRQCFELVIFGLCLKQFGQLGLSFGVSGLLQFDQIHNAALWPDSSSNHCEYEDL